jgi:thioredoxin-like negative regulator of GroEL
MDRLLMLLVVLAGTGVLWLVWQGIKLWLRHSIHVDRATPNEGRPALLYFYSDDCVPCRLQQGPIVASLRQRMGESVRFQEYDAVARTDIAGRYRVLTVPTTVVIAPGGKVVAINYGVTQADKLRRQLADATTGREELLTSSVARR